MEQQTSLLAGLIGAGIEASLTPPMHEREGEALGLRYVYRRIDLDELELDAAALPTLLNAAQQLGFNGLNITYPCKQAVIPLLDELAESARDIGAVNTVVLKNGRKFGHNTDYLGFAEGFRRRLGDVTRDRVVQLGAGGAGAAVAHALLSESVGVLEIHDLDPERAAGLVARLTQHFGVGRAKLLDAMPSTLARTDGLVNTTPVGMLKMPGMPLPRQLLRTDLWVAEIIYFPLETELLQQARALGCRTLDGGMMAVFQAVKSFELFTGFEPDADRMLAHFTSLL